MDEKLKRLNAFLSHVRSCPVCKWEGLKRCEEVRDVLSEKKT